MLKYNLSLPLIRTLRETKLLQNSWWNSEQHNCSSYPSSKGDKKKKGNNHNRKAQLEEMGQISPILLYWYVRIIPPVKQLSSMHMVLGWQHIFLLEDNLFGLIYSLYILCLCSEQMYTHIFMYYHCFIVWKTYCLNLLKLTVLIKHIMKYIWYITSVSKP